MRLWVIASSQWEWESSRTQTRELTAMAAREKIQLGLVVNRGLLVPPPRYESELFAPGPGGLFVGV